MRQLKAPLHTGNSLHCTLKGEALSWWRTDSEKLPDAAHVILRGLDGSSRIPMQQVFDARRAFYQATFAALPHTDVRRRVAWVRRCWGEQERRAGVGDDNRPAEMKAARAALFSMDPFDTLRVYEMVHLHIDCFYLALFEAILEQRLCGSRQPLEETRIWGVQKPTPVQRALWDDDDLIASAPEPLRV